MTKMINLIIWSKDRACQLHLLLESINKHCPFFDPHILYTYSNEEYGEGYRQLIENPPYDRGVFLSEDNFVEDTMNFVDNPAYEHVCFSTDDTVIYRKSLIDFDTLKCLFLPKLDNQVFTFRMGLNTIVQDCHRQTLQQPLHNPTKTNPCVMWNIKKYHPLSNYGYPLALDMHVFTKNYATNLVKKCMPWNNTNSLESNMQKYRNDIDFMTSFEKSIAINIPANNMSTVTRHGEQYGYSNKYLNDCYLSGQRISLDEIERENIVGCHQEVRFNLV